MRRSILLAIVAALALALGLSSLAVAGQDGAAVSAKKSKGKKKSKGCRSKGKGKSRRGKARRPAIASARNKKRGKSCGRNANWLEIGKYQGEGVIEVEIRSRKRVRVRFPEAPATCIPGIPSGGEAEDAKLTALKLTAGYVAAPSEQGFIQGWHLTVFANYKYKLVVDSDTTGIGVPCSKPGATFEGKLKKTG